jgi:ribosomal-protein-alanine N-acetyltransferase
MSAVIQPELPELRPMQERDLDGVMAIEERVYPFPWTRKIFADCLRVGYSCWVLELDAMVVGYSVLSAGAGEAHILNIGVDPDHQRRGFGGRMLNRLVNLARWHHARTLFLEVRPSNVAALKMYESFGFDVVGRRPNYYPADEGREDAIIMSLTVAPTGD